MSCPKITATPQPKAEQPQYQEHKDKISLASAEEEAQNGVATTSQETPLKRFTRAAVARHNTADSVWIILDNKVYDVTEWKEEHPGGRAVLLDRGGEDCTLAFEDMGHSEKARHIRKNFCIGELEEGWGEQTE